MSNEQNPNEPERVFMGKAEDPASRTTVYTEPIPGKIPSPTYAQEPSHSSVAPVAPTHKQHMQSDFLKMLLTVIAVLAVSFFIAFGIPVVLAVLNAAPNVIWIILGVIFAITAFTCLLLSKK